MNNTEPQSCLHRLSKASYLGRAWVHWSLTVDQRKQGWLNERSHGFWREILLHALHRYDLAVPVYCLMPDHAHILFVGTKKESDQLRALRFVRTQTRRRMFSHEYKWQRQAYDRVIRASDRTGSALRATCHYIAENPVRAGLVEVAREWPFCGSLLLGYPELDHLDPSFDRLFWRLAMEEPVS